MLEIHHFFTYFLAFHLLSFYNKGEQYKGGNPMSTIFIGIAGGTGSGKTTLTEHLAQRFGRDISVVHHDTIPTPLTPI